MNTTPSQPENQNTQLKQDAITACQRLGLDEGAYVETFEQIGRDWEEKGKSYKYLEHFLNPAVLKLCKTPNDFLRASEIVLAATESVWGYGSAGLWQTLIQNMENGRITTLDDLENLCDTLVEKNETFRNSAEGEFGTLCNGTQFSRFLAEIDA